MKISDILRAFQYYIDNGGYYEKANGTKKYLTREISNFAANKGSANYTYMGELCGINPGAWCAMMVSTAVHDGAFFSKENAKKALWGLWPYSRVRDLWNAAPDNRKYFGYYQRWTKGRGERKDYPPQPGYVIIFTDDKGTTLTHVGMVYAVDNTYVYTYEGNTSNMARKRSYRIDSAYIFGYVELNVDYDVEEGVETVEKYGSEITVKVYELSKGCAGELVERWQTIMNELKCTDDSGSELVIDGEFGVRTQQATKRFQKRVFTGENACTGVVNDLTWQEALFYKM